MNTVECFTDAISSIHYLKKSPHEKYTYFNNKIKSMPQVFQIVTQKQKSFTSKLFHIIFTKRNSTLPKLEHLLSTLLVLSSPTMVCHFNKPFFNYM